MPCAVVIVAMAWLISFVVFKRAEEAAKYRVWQFTDCARQMLFSESEFLPHDVVDEQGRRVASWRQKRYLEIAPIPESNGPRELPWTSPQYSRLRALSVDCFCFSGTSFTSIMAIVGNGTAFDLEERPSVNNLPSNCIVLVEVNQTKVNWLEPGDVSIDDLRIHKDRETEFIIPSSNLPGGYCVGFADGEVWRLRSDVPLEHIRKLAIVANAKDKSRDAILGRYRLDKSKWR